MTCPKCNSSNNFQYTWWQENPNLLCLGCDTAWESDSLDYKMSKIINDCISEYSYGYGMDFPEDAQEVKDRKYDL